MNTGFITGTEVWAEGLGIANASGDLGKATAFSTTAAGAPADAVCRAAPGIGSGDFGATITAGPLEGVETVGATGKATVGIAGRSLAKTWLIERFASTPFNDKTSI